MNHDWGKFADRVDDFLKVNSSHHPEFVRMAFLDLYEYLLEKADYLFYPYYRRGSAEWCARFCQLGEGIRLTPLRFLLSALAIDDHFYIRAEAKFLSHVLFADYEGDPEIYEAGLASYTLFRGPSPFSLPYLRTEIWRDRRIRRAEVYWIASELNFDFVPGRQEAQEAVLVV